MRAHREDEFELVDEPGPHALLEFVLQLQTLTRTRHQHEQGVSSE